MILRTLVPLLLLAWIAPINNVAQESSLTATETMIPMRDGVRLYTQAYTPTQKSEPIPIVLLRTPYGTGPLNAARVAASLAYLPTDGYIIVQQDIRGRFKSDGRFVMLRQPRDSRDEIG